MARRDDNTGKSLGHLIHSFQSGAYDLEGMGQQVLAAWRQDAAVQLELEPTRLLAGGQTLVEGEEMEGRWLLPTFMAGLRKIQLQPGATTEDLLRLVEELAAVGPYTEAIDHLRDWLWMDGAEGFEVDLEESFTETLEAAFVDPETAKQKLLAVRSRAAAALSRDSVAVDSRDLDAAAVQEEFQVALDGMTGAVQGRRFELDWETRDELRDLFLDTPFWTRAQLEFALGHPDFKVTASPEKLAQQLLTQIDTDVDLGLVKLIAELTRRPDAFSRSLVAVLEKEPIGEKMAEKMKLTERTAPVVAELLAGDRSRISQGLATGLLERAAADPTVQETLPAVVQGIGLQLFWRHLVLGELTVKSTGALTRILPRCEPNLAIARDVLQTSGASGRLVGALPPQALVRLRKEVRGFLERAPADQAEPVIDALCRSGDAECLRMMGELLVASGGERWHKKSLETLGEALVDHGLGAEFVVPLARNRDAKPNVRLVAYQATTRDPGTLTLATKRSATEFREPPPIKRWLEQARKQRKG